MHISINALLLGKYHSGVENYIFCLLDELNKIDSNDNLEIDVFIKSELQKELTEKWRNLKLKPVSGIGNNRLKRIFLLYSAALAGQLSDLKSVSWG